MGTIGAMFFTVPTLLTWARIVAIPLIVGVFYLGIEVSLQNLVATTLFGMTLLVLGTQRKAPRKVLTDFALLGCSFDVQ